MNIEQVQIFTSILALAALLGSVGVWLLRLTSLFSKPAADLVRTIGDSALVIAAMVAIGATLGSLYVFFRDCELYTVQALLVAAHRDVSALNRAKYRRVATRLTGTLVRAASGFSRSWRVSVPLYHRMVPDIGKDVVRPRGAVHPGVVSYLRVLLVGVHGWLRVYRNYHVPALPTQSRQAKRLSTQPGRWANLYTATVRTTSLAKRPVSYTAVAKPSHV